MNKPIAEGAQWALGTMSWGVSLPMGRALGHFEVPSNPTIL